MANKQKEIKDYDSSNITGYIGGVNLSVLEANESSGKSKTLRATALEKFEASVLAIFWDPTFFNKDFIE